MRLKLSKVQGHVTNLLTVFMNLRDKYALLSPMIQDGRVASNYDGGRQARGYAILRWTLFLDCCHDLANISFDDYDNTPSIRRLVLELQDKQLRKYICAQHSKGRLLTELCDVPDWRAAMLKKESQAVAADYALRYEERYSLLDLQWVEFEKSPTHRSFKTIRDKITAHTELRCIGRQYRPVEVHEQPIDWLDLKLSIDRTQQLITMLCDLTNDSTVAWESIDMLSARTSEFWDIKTALPYGVTELPVTGHVPSIFKFPS